MVNQHIFVKNLETTLNAKHSFVAIVVARNAATSDRKSVKNPNGLFYILKLKNVDNGVIFGAHIDPFSKTGAVAKTVELNDKIKISGIVSKIIDNSAILSRVSVEVL